MSGDHRTSVSLSEARRLGGPLARDSASASGHAADKSGSDLLVQQDTENRADKGPS